MSTTWQILTGGSTLASGTAWEHLNAQGGGGFTGDQVYQGESFIEVMAGEVIGTELLPEVITDTAQPEIITDTPTDEIIETFIPWLISP